MSVLINGVSLDVLYVFNTFLIDDFSRLFMTFLLKKILLLLFSQHLNLNLIGLSNFNFEVTTTPNNMLQQHARVDYVSLNVVFRLYLSPLKFEF